MMKTCLGIALGALLVAFSAFGGAWAHDGTWQERSDDVDGMKVITKASEWWGRWEICYMNLQGEEQCPTGLYWHAWPYEQVCLDETRLQMEGNELTRWNNGFTSTGSTLECTEDPVAAGWPQDPREPCTHPRNWWSHDCVAEVQAWLAERTDTPPLPDPTPDPEPDPEPEPTPDPAPGPELTLSPLIVGPDSVTVEFTWSEPATGQTDYGTTPEPDATWQTHGPETSFLSLHRQQIGGLLPATQYYFVVKGTNAAGETTTSGVGSFTTTQ